MQGHSTAARVALAVLALFCASSCQSRSHAAASTANPADARPRIETDSESLDFAGVALAAMDFRRLVLRNMPVEVSGTTADNLRFGTSDANGVWLDQPPQIVGADAGEFGVEWPPPDLGPEGLPPWQDARVGVWFSPSSTGPKAATLVIRSNDPERRVVEVPLSGRGVARCDLVLQPATLDFGTVEPNGLSRRELAIVNREPDPKYECPISGIALSAATKELDVFELYEALDSASIPGGARLVVASLEFAPTKPGSYAGELEFQMTGGEYPINVTVPLLGESPPCAQFSPSEIELGRIPTGCSSRARVAVISNVCSYSITVTAVDLEQDTSREFVLADGPAVPFTIPSHGQAAFTVAYQPVSPADATAAVAVTLAGGVDPMRLEIIGHGESPTTKSDVYSQSDQPKADFLFVIDNSSSMADKQAAVAANLNASVQLALQLPVSWHFAVTTTDVSESGEAGRFVPLAGPFPRVVDASTPNAAQVLAQNLAVGSDGSESESLLRPAYLALTNPLINGHNAGFYRDEANLEIIIVSDAADQDPLSTPVSFYESFFLNIKGIKRRHLETVSAIIPTQTQARVGCSYDMPLSGLDTRVTELVRRTGGVLADICDPNWSATLERLFMEVGGLRTVFFLSDVPDMSVTPDPITATVDNVRVDPYDPATGERRWEYSAIKNAVEFVPLRTPGPGSTLAITYRPACGG